MPPYFTTRERQLIARVIAGDSNRQIAETLGLKEQTIRNRLTVIFGKCHVTSRLQLALYVTREGLDLHIRESSPRRRTPG
jgi:two-component system, NarL family, nitrate/nitrite response regulator NarL